MFVLSTLLKVRSTGMWFLDLFLHKEQKRFAQDHMLDYPLIFSLINVDFRRYFSAV